MAAFSGWNQSAKASTASLARLQRSGSLKSLQDEGLANQISKQGSRSLFSSRAGAKSAEKKRERASATTGDSDAEQPGERQNSNEVDERETSKGTTTTALSSSGMLSMTWKAFLQKVEETLFGDRVAYKRPRHTAFVQNNEKQAFRSRLHNGLKTNLTKIIAAFMVALNVMLIIIEADYDVRYGAVPRWIEASSFFFLVYFAVELLAKLFVYRLKFFNDKVNTLDVIVVLIDIVGVVLEASIGEMPSFSSLRALRFLRITRILKEFFAFRELYLMICGLISAVRAIFFGSALILVVLAMWAVFAVQVLHPMTQELLNDGDFDCERCMHAYNSVPRAMLTLAQLTVVADSWDLYARPLLQYRPSSALIIIPAYICVQLGLVNVIAAVIVDRQASAREDDASLQHIHHLEELDTSFIKLASIFDRADSDGSGVLDQSEIIEAFDSDENFRQMLEVLDITRDDMETVFEILDPDGSGTVSYVEFVEKLHYIRLINPHTLMVFMKHRTESLLVDTQDMIDSSQTMLLDLAQRTELIRSQMEQSIQRLHERLTENLIKLGCDTAIETIVPPMPADAPSVGETLETLGGCRRTSSIRRRQSVHSRPPRHNKRLSTVISNWSAGTRSEEKLCAIRQAAGFLRTTSPDTPTLSMNLAEMANGHNHLENGHNYMLNGHNNTQNGHSEGESLHHNDDQCHKCEKLLDEMIHVRVVKAANARAARTAAAQAKAAGPAREAHAKASATGPSTGRATFRGLSTFSDAARSEPDVKWELGHTAASDTAL
eukprot:TRINITY_DN22531_c0_g1_i5.p1 TRINITY_DN22531_c0_g1~~TRINITY_DN22531_c0_g1_i5.p1  ORF type:complete len:775 (+),score=90.99 TRINITY_DN22531_c0_g1_i5:80-2404(+)